jgi:hypothetical protein
VEQIPQIEIQFFIRAQPNFPIIYLSIIIDKGWYTHCLLEGLLLTKIKNFVEPHQKYITV